MNFQDFSAFKDLLGPKDYTQLAEMVRQKVHNENGYELKKLKEEI
jgi:hypothetical protein